MPKKRATEADSASTSTSRGTEELSAQELLDRRRAQNMLAQRRYREKNKQLKLQKQQQQQQQQQSGSSGSNTAAHAPTVNAPNPPATSTSSNSTSIPSTSNLDSNLFNLQSQSNPQIINGPFQSNQQQQQQNLWQQSVMQQPLQPLPLPWEGIQSTGDIQMFDGDVSMNLNSSVGLDSNQTAGNTIEGGRNENAGGLTSQGNNVASIQSTSQMLSLPFDPEAWRKPPAPTQDRITELWKSAMGIEHSTSSSSLLSNSTKTSFNSNQSSTSSGSHSSNSSSSNKSDSNSPPVLESNSPEKDFEVIGSSSSCTDLTFNQPSSHHPQSQYNAKNYHGTNGRRNSDFSNMLEQILHQDTSNAIASSITESEIFQTAFQRYLTDQGIVFPELPQDEQTEITYLKVKGTTLRELIRPLTSSSLDDPTKSRFNFPERNFHAALYTNALSLGFSRSELDDCTGISSDRISSSWPPKDGQGEGGCSMMKVRERFGNSVTGGIGPYTYGQGESPSIFEVVEKDERDFKIQEANRKREELLKNATDEDLEKISTTKKELRWDLVPSNMYPTRSQILIE